MSGHEKGSPEDGPVGMTSGISTLEPGQYVQRVREDTRRYIEDLLAENEKLRRLAAEVDGERRRLEDEASRWREQASGLARELDSFRQDRERLALQLSQIEQENHGFSSRFTELQQRNNDLANLYVATYRLHSTLDRDEVLQAIQEIVINLIGCEEFGIYDLAPGASELHLVSSFGLVPGRLEQVRLGEGRIGAAAESGRAFFAEDAAEPAPDARETGEQDLSACIPLRLDGRVAGLIALFRLLPQKGGRFAPIDAELFDLLAAQAATAVYRSQLERQPTAA